MAKREKIKLLIDSKSNPNIGPSLSRLVKGDDEKIYVHPSIPEGMASSPDLIRLKEINWVFSEAGRFSPESIPAGSVMKDDFLLIGEIAAWHQAGGGLNSSKALERLSLTDEALERLEKISRVLRNQRILHLRNTDYAFDPDDQQLQKNYQHFSVTASDSSLNQLNIPGRTETGRGEQDFLELLGFAFAEQFFSPPIRFSNRMHSGFGRLAKFLWAFLRLSESGLRPFVFSGALNWTGIASGFGRLNSLVFFFFFLPRILRILVTPTGTYLQLLELNTKVSSSIADPNNGD